MKPLSTFLGLLFCTSPLLQGQSEISAPPVEIKPPEAVVAGPSDSSSTGTSLKNRKARRLERHRQPAPAAPNPSEPVSSLAELDTDRDGKVSLPEFLRHQHELADRRARLSFEEQDLNRDGQLTEEELTSSTVKAGAGKARRTRSNTRQAAVPESLESAPEPQRQPPVSTAKPVPEGKVEGGVVEIAPPPGKR